MKAKKKKLRLSARVTDYERMGNKVYAKSGAKAFSKPGSLNK